MGRKQDEVRLDNILAAIQANPDNRPGTIGTMLGLDDKTIQRSLAQLEDRGDLLEENDEGKVRWFGKRK